MKRLLCARIGGLVDPSSPARPCRRLNPVAWCLPVVLSACSLAPSWPPMPLPETMTRQQIEQFRSREQARLDTALRECYQRFAVNDCRREAMSRHHEVVHQLRQQELRLNALDREARQRKLQELPSAGERPEAGSSSGTPP